MTKKPINPPVETMRLRDFFAGCALSQIGRWDTESDLGYGSATRKNYTPLEAKDVAEAAYIVADAMLAERAKRGDS